MGFAAVEWESRVGGIMEDAGFGDCGGDFAGEGKDPFDCSALAMFDDGALFVNTASLDVLNGGGCTARSRSWFCK